MTTLIFCLFAASIGYRWGEHKAVEPQPQRPEFYQPQDHRELIEACSSACRRSGSRFVGYKSLDGECNCGEQK